MDLKNIKIQNYKSIENISIDVEKLNGSFTNMFLGVNESGKSNILKAISFLSRPKNSVKFKEIRNKNLVTEKYVDIFFNFKPNSSEILKDVVGIHKFEDLKKLKVENVEVNIYLSKELETFARIFKYKVNLGKCNLGFTGDSPSNFNIVNLNEIPDEEKINYKKIGDEGTDDLYSYLFDESVIQYLPVVNFWKPSGNYLLNSSIDLNEFKLNPDSNLPLKNMFRIAGYQYSSDIKTILNDITDDMEIRRELQTNLSDTSTKYVNDVWKHPINIDVEITETMKCTVNITDKITKNKFHKMSDRSDGFKQFMSLILSISVMSKKANLKKRLILIDEPEIHLHPSGIIDMREELLKIGKKNYLFLSTHSNFMVDTKEQKRNIVVKKNNENNTIVQRISDKVNVYEDEVLREAFGMNLFKDLMTPNKLLVEGYSDKVIINKVIKELGIKNILLTNGTGDNLVNVASLFNLHEISPFIVIDDDESGKQNKTKISKISDSIKNNTFTIKEIENSLVDESTIEDLFPKEFVLETSIKILKDNYELELELELDENMPFVDQIKKQIKNFKNSLKKSEIKEIMNNIKREISNSFSTENLDSDFPKLKSFVKNLVEKICGDQDE